MIFAAMVSLNTYAHPTAKVFIQPHSTTIKDFGETFTVNVNVANISNLYGYEFKVFYNTTILDGVEVELPSGHFLTPDNPPNIFIIRKEINDTLGRVWVATSLLAPETPKNGSGLLASITFNVTALDSSSLRLQDVKLSDHEKQQIASDLIDGEVVVVYGPPIDIVLLLIIIIAAAIIISGMIIVLRRKSK